MSKSMFTHCLFRKNGIWKFFLLLCLVFQSGNLFGVYRNIPGIARHIRMSLPTAVSTTISDNKEIYIFDTSYGRFVVMATDLPVKYTSQSELENTYLGIMTGYTGGLDMKNTRMKQNFFFVKNYEMLEASFNGKISDYEGPWKLLNLVYNDKALTVQFFPTVKMSVSELPDLYKLIDIKDAAKHPQMQDAASQILDHIKKDSRMDRFGQGVLAGKILFFLIVIAGVTLLVIWLARRSR